MANKQRGELSMTVEGVVYTLRPSLESICALEELRDEPFHKVVERAEQGRMGAVRDMVWAYLHECHAAEIVTLKDASRWIERAGGVEVLSEKLQQLAEINTDPSQPPTKGEGPRPPDAQAGTGASSTSEPEAPVSRPTSSGRPRRANSSGSSTPLKHGANGSESGTSPSLT